MVKHTALWLTNFARRTLGLTRWVGTLMAVLVFPAAATTINLGFISFDTLIPDAPGAPGVTNFTINNFTEGPSLGGFALPPDFPVFSSLTFQNSTLLLTTPTTSLSFNLGDFGPGSFIPAALEFPSTMLFTSATFTASLSLTDLQLFDGTTFAANSDVLSATILPSSGSTLTPGTDLALLQVSNTAATPEPAAYRLCAGALLILLLLTSWRAAKSSPCS